MASCLCIAALVKQTASLGVHTPSYDNDDDDDQRKIEGIGLPLAPVFHRQSTTIQATTTSDYSKRMGDRWLGGGGG